MRNGRWKREVRRSRAVSEGKNRQPSKREKKKKKGTEFREAEKKNHWSFAGNRTIGGEACGRRRDKKGKKKKRTQKKTHSRGGDRRK